MHPVFHPRPVCLANHVTEIQRRRRSYYRTQQFQQLRAHPLATAFITYSYRGLLYIVLAARLKRRCSSICVPNCLASELRNLVADRTERWSSCFYVNLLPKVHLPSKFPTLPSGPQESPGTMVKSPCRNTLVYIGYVLTKYYVIIKSKLKWQIQRKKSSLSYYELNIYRHMGNPSILWVFCYIIFFDKRGNTIDVCQHEHFDCNNVVCV